MLLVCAEKFIVKGTNVPDDPNLFKTVLAITDFPTPKNIHVIRLGLVEERLNASSMIN